MKQKQIAYSTRLEVFDGVSVHPSLHIKDGVLVLGFRYRTKEHEERDVLIVADGSTIRYVHEPLFEAKGRRHYVEKRQRKLMRIDERWSSEHLQQFVDGYSSAASSPSLPATFEKMVELGKRFVELERESDYHLLAAWIIGTYFSPLFYAYPFLHIKAPKRSGKSQCLTFLWQTCFNAVKALPSFAALGDTVDALHGAYLIDQADMLFHRGNDELLDILADSYKQGGGKRRIVSMDKRRGTRETLEIETYGPKAFASIRELPEDLRDRCLMIPLLRSRKNFPDPDESSENWREVRGELYKLLLVNFDLIAGVYHATKAEYRRTEEMSGRSLELWLPLEVVLRCCSAEDKIAEAKSRFRSHYSFTEYEPSEIESAVLTALLGLFGDTGDAMLSPSDIAKAVERDLFPSAYTTKERAATVGRVLKKFNVPSEKMPRHKTGVRYKFNRNKVEIVMRRYFTSGTDPTSPTPADENGLCKQDSGV